MCAESVRYSCSLQISSYRTKRKSSKPAWEIGSVTSGGSSSGGSSSTSESSSSNSDYEHLQAHEGSGIDWSKYNTGDGGFNFR